MLLRCGKRKGRKGLVFNTHATFEKVPRPKVGGTVFLDEMFSNHDLDLVSIFSSLAAVSGNISHNAHAAANNFKCSLAAGLSACLVC